MKTGEFFSSTTFRLLFVCLLSCLYGFNFAPVAGAQAPNVGDGKVVGTYCTICGKTVTSCPHMGGGGGGGGEGGGLIGGLLSLFVRGIGTICEGIERSSRQQPRSQTITNNDALAEKDRAEHREKLARLEVFKEEMDKAVACAEQKPKSIGPKGDYDSVISQARLVVAHLDKALSAMSWEANDKNYKAIADWKRCLEAEADILEALKEVDFDKAIRIAKRAVADVPNEPELLRRLRVLEEARAGIAEREQRLQKEELIQKQKALTKAQTETRQLAKSLSTSQPSDSESGLDIVGSSRGMNVKPSASGQGAVKALDEAATNLGATKSGLSSPDTDDGQRRQGTRFFGESGSNMAPEGPAGESGKAGSGKVFDTGTERKSSGIVVDLSGAGKRPEWLRALEKPKVRTAMKDYEAAQQKLDTLEAERAQLDAQRTKLAQERNTTQAPAEFAKKDQELRQMDQNYGAKLVLIKVQKEEVAKKKEFVEYAVDEAGKDDQKDKKDAAPSSGDKEESK